MRVAVVTESFLPQVNGVTNTVRKVVDHLRRTGHQALIIAPGPGPADYEGVPVVRVRSVGMPGYRSFPIGLPDASVERALADFDPDVVHLASPIALGAVGLRAARRLGLPTVAIYQTDIAGFARHYKIRADLLTSAWVGRLHRRVDRTLVPSRTSYAQLEAMGVENLHLWRRGVSLDLFGPGRRNEELHHAWAPEGETVVGYVGRLAPEKQVRRLAEVAKLPGVKVVVVGDGPDRAALQRMIPEAVFTGMLGGEDLATAFATLDVFVHPGESETFCQTVQEAQASGVPVVAVAAGGPLDLVDHGRTGMLYDPRAAGALTQVVATLVDDLDLRQAMAARALTEVAQRTWTTVVDQLVDVHYPAVLRRPRASSAAA